MGRSSQSDVYKMAGEDEAVKEPAAQEEAAECEASLDGHARKEEIMGIFKQLDTTSSGSILLDDLKGATISVGPTKTDNFYETLKQMDFNGDGVVDAKEWEMYFATIVETLTTDDELNIVLEPLKAKSSCVGLRTHTCTRAGTCVCVYVDVHVRV